MISDVIVVNNTTLMRTVLYPNVNTRNVDAGIFYVDDVDGFGPVSTRLNMSKIGLTYGKIVNSSTYDERNIVFHLVSYESGSKMAMAKTTLINKSFQVGSEVNVGVKRDGKTCAIQGIIESCETDWLTKENETGITVSIICPKPFFSVPEHDVDDPIEVKIEKSMNYHFEVPTKLPAQTWSNQVVLISGFYGRNSTVQFWMDTGSKLTLSGIDKFLGSDERVNSISIYPRSQYIRMTIRNGNGDMRTVNITSTIASKNTDWEMFFPRESAMEPLKTINIDVDGGQGYLYDGHALYQFTKRIPAEEINGVI